MDTAIATRQALTTEEFDREIADANLRRYVWVGVREKLPERRDFHTANDIVQQALLEVITQYRATFDPARGSLKSLVMVIAKRIAGRIVRRRERSAERGRENRMAPVAFTRAIALHLHRQTQERIESPVVNAAQLETVHRVHRAMGRLQPVDVGLMYAELAGGVSVAERIQTLGFSSKPALFRARERAIINFRIALMNE